MSLQHLAEPELEFGSGRHIDIRFGISGYGPLDIDRRDLRAIRVGIVGTAEAIETLSAWLEHCSVGIEAKDSRQPNLFVPFPGFQADVGYRADLVIEPRTCRAIASGRFKALADKASHNLLVSGAADLFCAELSVLEESGGVDVVICALPMELLRDMIRGYRSNERADSDDLNFRRLLKARAMQATAVPIQLLLPTTYRPEYRSELPKEMRGAINLQDEATRAWNLHTALYYKAGGTPWRVSSEADAFSVCYVGVSFFEAESDELHTSVAQVFSERGDGLIIRGGQAKVAKDDRQPHLDVAGAYALLDASLTRYRQEHMTAPARVVLHKTSPFSPEEMEGFESVCAEHRIGDVDLVWIRGSNTRLFRDGRYPPLRGTFFQMAERSVLYTRGSVDFYATYPGMYVPRPLALHVARSDHAPESIAREVLALTKMNWNDTQFDNREPITIKAARKVGEILPYLAPSDRMPARYSYYM
jgi:hypothetical protein